MVMRDCGHDLQFCKSLCRHNSITRRQEPVSSGLSLHCPYTSVISAGPLDYDGVALRPCAVRCWLVARPWMYQGGCSHHFRLRRCTDSNSFSRGFPNLLPLISRVWGSGWSISSKFDKYLLLGSLVLKVWTELGDCNYY